MESQIELKNAKNDVYRKIGRNMLLFQQMERFLKILIVNGNMAGYISEIKSNQEKRAAAINKKTMGQLVGDYIENTYSPNKEIPEGPKELTEPYVQFRFQLGVDENFYETKKQALAAMVADRNELIHNLLPRIDLNSIESLVKTEHDLDQQREKLLHEINVLKSVIKGLQEIRKKTAVFLMSDKASKLLFSPLGQSRTLFLLGEIASKASRADGWTLLNIAGEQIRKHAPEEISGLYQNYGHKTLKGLILATELFDIKEEPTNKGGIRVLYRLKPNWTFQKGDEPETVGYQCSDCVAEGL